MTATILDPSLPLALLSRIEDAGLNASTPPQQRWLDGWLVRLAASKAKRARCVNAVAGGRLPFDERLAAASAAFAEAGLPLLVRITPFSEPADLDFRLAGLGFRTLDDTRVMVRPSLAGLPPPVLPSGFVLQPLPYEAFAEQVGLWRGTPAPERRVHGERLASLPVRCRPYGLRDADGQCVAAGQITQEGSLVGLYDVFTPPAQRGRGHARVLCHALLASAHEAGAHSAYLQVESDNAPARAVYRRLGFADAYGYHYRTDDPHAH